MDYESPIELSPEQIRIWAVELIVHRYKAEQKRNAKIKEPTLDTVIALAMALEWYIKQGEPMP